MGRWADVPSLVVVGNGTQFLEEHAFSLLFLVIVAHLLVGGLILREVWMRAWVCVSLGVCCVYTFRLHHDTPIRTRGETHVWDVCVHFCDEMGLFLFLAGILDRHSRFMVKPFLLSRCPPFLC